MKKEIYIGILALIFSFSAIAQEHGGKLLEKSVPAVDLKDIEGKTINTGKFDHDGPIIISFWATWCSPCKKELNAIAEEYDDWVDETNVKLIAVSIDDERTRSRVAPYVNGQGWDYQVLLDPNSEFRRAMGVNNVPHTFVIDKNGKIVYSHNNYSPGDEEALYEFIVSLKEDDE